MIPAAQNTKRHTIALSSLALAMGVAMTAGRTALDHSVIDLAAVLVVAVIAIVVVVVVSHMSGAPV